MGWEIVQAIVTSWPFWVAVIAIVFVLIFRLPIANLINRIRGIGRTGIIAAPGEQTTAPAGDPRRAADELRASLDNQYVLAREETIRGELLARGLPDTSPDTVGALIRITAAALVALELERICGVIWGSQIDILNHLNSRVGAPREELLPHYQAAATRYPDAFGRYPFEQYMNYLLSQGLVEQQGETFRIALKGRTFLLYLVLQGKPRPEG